MSLNNNRLNKLPQDLGSLDELTELDVTNNRLQALPSDLGRLPALNVLVQGNALVFPPKSVYIQGSEVLIRYMHALYVSRKSLICDLNGYGLTEACVITSLAGGDYAAPGSSGKRIPEYDVRIVDDLDREVPTNTPGEVVVRPLHPDIMFMGYWRRPEETLKLMRNMWFHTGDIGKFDEDGFFYFIDRKKDYLRRRGENISSFEMEAAFSDHPDIAEVAVHAVPSDKGEDDVKITAILRDGATLAEEALFHWSLDVVPYYALPRYIEFRSSLPKNPQGRVLKYLLRDEGKTDATWDLEDSDTQVPKR